MTTSEYPQKKSKKELVEMALKLQEESTARKQKLAKMEAEIEEITKVSSGKENKGGENNEKLDTKQAEKSLKQIKIDESLIKSKEAELINNGYKKDAAKKIAGVYGAIGAQEKRESILTSNPEVKDSEKRLQSVRKSIEESKNEITNLLKDINNQEDPIKVAKSKTFEFIKQQVDDAKGNIPEKPETDEEKARRKSEELKAELEAKENAEKGKEDSKYNFVWGESWGGYRSYLPYKEGIFIFEINGKESEVTVSEKKTDWKRYSLWQKIIRFNFKQKGKEIFKEKPTWTTLVSTENEELDKKYPKVYEFKTKEEAIKKAEEIIDEGLKIKFEEEKKFMGIKGPEPSQEPVATPPVTKPEPEPASPTPTSPEPTPPLTSEKIIFYENVLKAKDEEFKNRLKNGNLSEKMRGGVLKALDKWENFGKNEKGTKGFAKRMGKNAINLALIGIISSFAVEKLAEAGTGTAAALGGGTFSYLGRKMAIGLGIGAAFEGVGKGFSNDNSKGVRIAKKAMPYILGIASVSASVFLTGGMVGAAAGLGTASTMLMRHWYASEKIEKREENAKQKLLDKIRASGEEIDISQVKIYEDEYIKILKKYENQKLRGRLLVGIAKIGIGSLVSGLTLEASGAHMQANIDEHNKEIAEAESNHKEALKRLEDLNKEHKDAVERIAGLDKQHEQSVADLKHQTELKEQQAEQENTEAKADQSKPDDSNQTVEKDQAQESQNQSEVKVEDIIVHKGEGIEHSFIRQIEHNSELAKELGYKGDVDDTKALHEFAGRQAHVIAIKTGYVDNQGHEIRIAEADKTGYEIKMENGHVSVIEKTSTGEIVETHNEGDKFEEKIEKGEYVKDFGQKTNTETVAGSGANNTPIDTPHITEPSGEYSAGEQINPETGLPMEHTHPEQINPETGKPYHAEGDVGKTVSEEGGSGNVNTERDLTPAEIEHVHNVFDRNIDHLFRGRPEGEWNSIQKLIPADRILELYNKGEVESYFKPLVHHMMKLEEVTGLRPYSYDPIDHPEGPEKIPVFIGRALEEAARIGKLDEVTL